MLRIEKAQQDVQKGIDAERGLSASIAEGEKSLRVTHTPQASDGLQRPQHILHKILRIFDPD